MYLEVKKNKKIRKNSSTALVALRICEFSTSPAYIISLDLIKVKASYFEYL